jgi:hypothetical protein
MFASPRPVRPLADTANGAAGMRATLLRRGYGVPGIDGGSTRRPNGAFGKSDIEGKAAREAASELGKERVSKERERVSQSVHWRI